GSAIVKDLAANADFAVTVVDLNPATVQRLADEAGVRGVATNVGTLDRLDDLLDGADLVVCAVPGFMGFATLKKIIEAGKNVVDISFFGEDPFLLD
ncbi:MAG: saccharopine dehydrogenase NADP-binding domain-containing protein, partial [Caldilineaceae bacterium]|nr:saccharopine dehydrogenase NADP-binding domain-containing protein [Caldilineaceae bacterium]